VFQDPGSKQEASQHGCEHAPRHDADVGCLCCSPAGATCPCDKKSPVYDALGDLPVFGSGAKTSRFCKKATPLFPMSRNIRNPFITNDKSSLEDAYYDCLASLEMSIPINL